MLYLIGGGIGLKNKPRILSHLLSISTGSKVCVIVTASGDPEKIGGLYKRAFFSLGADNCAILNPRSKCDASSVPDALHDCDIIFFSGGDQLVLSNALRGTAMWQKIADHFEAGHMIAGTSAGAAAMSLRMIYGPDDWTVGKPEDSVSLEAGLGLMPNLVIDTHFSERHRLLRLQMKKPLQ
jgi:cyanophycinase